MVVYDRWVCVCPGPDHRDDMPIWELLPAAEFYTFTIPFQMDGPTKVGPQGLQSVTLDVITIG